MAAAWWIACVRVIGHPFRDLLRQPSGNVSSNAELTRAGRRDRPHTKAGGSNDQTSDQAWDVGTNSDGAEHCALAHPGPCGWRWWRWRRWWWWRRFFRHGPRAFLSPFVFPAFVLPAAVAHSSPP